MSAEQLYLIIGFLLGVLLMGSIMLALLLVYYEWVTKKEQD
jgi:hypothetical protein